jgi:hypothetical protein
MKSYDVEENFSLGYVKWLSWRPAVLLFSTGDDAYITFYKVYVSRYNELQTLSIRYTCRITSVISAATSRCSVSFAGTGWQYWLGGETEFNEAYSCKNEATGNAVAKAAFSTGLCGTELFAQP